MLEVTHLIVAACFLILAGLISGRRIEWSRASETGSQTRCASKHVFTLAQRATRLLQNRRGQIETPLSAVCEVTLTLLSHHCIFADQCSANLWPERNGRKRKRPHTTSDTPSFANFRSYVTLLGYQVRALHTKLLSICREASELRADYTAFPPEWLFHHRYITRPFCTWAYRLEPSGISYCGSAYAAS